MMKHPDDLKYPPAGWRYWTLYLLHYVVVVGVFYAWWEVITWRL
jgi:hypothetical protein